MPSFDFASSPFSNLECIKICPVDGYTVLVARATIRVPAIGITLNECGVYFDEGVGYVCPAFVIEEGSMYPPAALGFDTEGMMFGFMDAALEAVLRFAPSLFEGRK